MCGIVGYVGDNQAHRFFCTGFPSWSTGAMTLLG